MSGQMKMLLDRLYNGLQGWGDRFEKATLKELISGGGIGASNDAKNHEETMRKAYDLGRKL